VGKGKKVQIRFPSTGGGGYPWVSGGSTPKNNETVEERSRVRGHLVKQTSKKKRQQAKPFGVQWKNPSRAKQGEGKPDEKRGGR